MPDVDPIDTLVASNRDYARGHRSMSEARPSRALAVVTCMDTRIDALAALGLSLGEAHVIRNAGGRMTEDVARSLALSSHVLGVRTVVLMQHTKCGLAGVDDEQLREATGADIDFLPIEDHAAALADDVRQLAATKWLDRIEQAAGFLYDLDSGVVTTHARWTRAEQISPGPPGAARRE